MVISYRGINKLNEGNIEIIYQQKQKFEETLVAGGSQSK